MAPLDRIEPIRGREARAALRKEPPTMRVTMTESRQASPDGVAVVSLIAGEEYDLPDHLARRYIVRGAATETAKAQGPAPENKALDGPAVTKSPPATRRRRTSSRSKGS